MNQHYMRVCDSGERKESIVSINQLLCYWWVNFRENDLYEWDKRNSLSYTGFS